MARCCSALRHADSEINHMVNPEVKSRSWITIWSLSSAPTLKRSFISPLPCPEYFSSRERCGRSAAGHPLLNYRLRQWTRPWINWHVIFFFFSLRTFINDWGTLCSAATQCTLVLLPAFNIAGTSSQTSSVQRNQTSPSCSLNSGCCSTEQQRRMGQSQKSDSEP